ncbi:MAG: DMT family transporter [Eubacteriaceae bacterium]|nr:DMT family transporter [Eubacteriaceae bacterium]
MKKDMTKSHLPHLALLTATLIWGGSFVIMKNATASIPTNYLLAIRFTGASILLSVIFNKNVRKMNFTYVKHGIIMGSALFFAYCFQTWGLLDTTPGKNAFLTAVYCVFVPFLSFFLGKDRPDKFNFFAAVMCIAGIGLVSLDGSLTMGKGDILTLVGGFFFAVHMIATAAFSKEGDPVVLTIVQFMTAAVYSWLLGILFEEFPTSFPLDTVLELGYLICFATATCLLLQSFGQKYTSPSAASILLSLESVFGVIFSVIFYKEKVTFKMLTGFVLIFVAIIISETKLEFLRKSQE